MVITCIQSYHDNRPLDPIHIRNAYSLSCLEWILQVCPWNTPLLFVSPPIINRMYNQIPHDPLLVHYRDNPQSSSALDLDDLWHQYRILHPDNDIEAYCAHVSYTLQEIVVVFHHIYSSCSSTIHTSFEHSPRHWVHATNWKTQSTVKMHVESNIVFIHQRTNCLTYTEGSVTHDRNVFFLQWKRMKLTYVLGMNKIV